MSAGKINDAVQECLTECYSSPNPLATLVSFANRLKKDNLWQQSEVDQVETTVRRILTAMMGEKESD
jgi:hypothetical protein